MGAAPTSETILVVQDDPQVREITSRALQAAGYRVIAAAGGEAALGAMARHGEELDLLVADLSTPGMDGRELAEKLRGDRPDLRVLYLAGYTQDVLPRPGVIDAGIEILRRPFTEAHLQERVRRVLESGWSEKLATGIAAIDSQHRALLADVGALGRAADAGEPDRTVELLRSVEGLISLHFATEEQFMRSAGYPGLAGHGAVHREFVGAYLQRRSEVVASGLPAAGVVELADWLSAWVHAHVRSADTEMAAFLRSRPAS
jgi:hemerythrin-like metal-binding protein